MNKLVSPKTVALTFGVFIICFMVAFYVVAWQEPTEAPPAGNVPTPLNVGLDHQTKEGDLTIGIAEIHGDGSMSPELNADKLDDYHAADLMAQTGGGASFVRWGDTTCPDGWTVAYTGYGPFISVRTMINDNAVGMMGLAVCAPRSSYMGGGDDYNISCVYAIGTSLFSTQYYGPCKTRTPGLSCAVCVK